MRVLGSRVSKRSSCVRELVRESSCVRSWSQPVAVGIRDPTFNLSMNTFTVKTMFLTLHNANFSSVNTMNIT